MSSYLFIAPWGSRSKFLGTLDLGPFANRVVVVENMLYQLLVHSEWMEGAEGETRIPLQVVFE